MKVEYSSNNSGGGWWLKDADWKALEAAGWDVEWRKGSKYADSSGRWLGALATNASREGLSLGEAISEWEAVTGQNSADLGCSCCGTPHNFTAYDDNGGYVESYSPEYPSEGSRYGDW